MTTSSEYFASNDDALLSADPITRIVARGVCSKWAAEFQAWVNAEVKQGTTDDDLIIAITRLFVLTHSSVAANILKPSGFQVAADMFKACTDAEYLAHAEKCKQVLQARRAAR
jgi:hypothetical protein